MSTQTITSTNTLQERSTSYKHDQYTLWQILGIWAAATLPLALTFWVIFSTILAINGLV